MTWLLVPMLVVLLTAAWLSSLGVLAARDAFDRLHYLGPVSVVGGPALLLAVLVQSGCSQVTGKVALLVVILLATGPVVTHAIARAGLLRGDARRLRDEQWELLE
jgi:monovalent cation/proton antiporter MnhG/PhaG subunit